jgi:endonuclease YncB( thermonuclease family)
MTVRLGVLLLTGAIALGAPAAAGAQKGRVVRVADGDSVVVRAGVHAHTYDLLGVDAPGAGECFGTQAKAALKRLLPRRAKVRLARDPRGSRRGRYITRGSKLINAAVLRAGAARPAGIDGLRKAGRLRSAASAAQGAGRGLFGACGAADPTGPGGPTTPAVPGAVDNADRVRAALVGRQLVEFTSTARSSSRDTTRFCAGARTDRAESFTGEVGHVENEFHGSWNVFGIDRRPDGSLEAQIVLTYDDPSDGQKAFILVVGQDGAVTSPGVNASELQDGGGCAAAQQFGTLQNDTTAARDKVRQLLVSRRLVDGPMTTDFCSATRAIRREASAVLDGTMTIESALVDDTGFAAAIALKGASGSRRFLVLGDPGGPPFQMRDLGVGTDTAHAVTTGAVSC